MQNLTWAPLRPLMTLPVSPADQYGGDAAAAMDLVHRLPSMAPVASAAGSRPVCSHSNPIRESEKNAG